MKLKLADILAACHTCSVNGYVIDVFVYGRDSDEDICLCGDSDVRYHFDKDIEVDLAEWGECEAPLGGASPSFDNDHDEQIPAGEVVNMQFEISVPLTPAMVNERRAIKEAIR